MRALVDMELLIMKKGFSMQKFMGNSFHLARDFYFHSFHCLSNNCCTLVMRLTLRSALRKSRRTRSENKRTELIFSCF